MRHSVRLMLAVFFAAMTVPYVKRGDALQAALNSSLATYWLVRWMMEVVV